MTIPINPYLFSDDDNRIVLRALPTNTEHNEFINGGFVDVSPCMVWCHKLYLVALFKI